MKEKLSRDNFSRIQDRFSTKIHLDSQDVEEVIQKRLLEKQGDAKKVLSDLYHNEVNNFKTLFDFTEGQVLKNFKSEEHFIDCYPFIPYQFTLFQNAMQELSRHGAFAGDYTSVGARSILKVFQEVAIKVSENNQVGEIATFDMMPEMSAYKVCDKACEVIKSGKYDVMILNFANCDMVGHTGVVPAAKKAVKVTSECVKKVIDAILSIGGQAIITADHGNCDYMFNPDGSPFTAHTTNPVPLIAVGNNEVKALMQGGKLCDIAPTMLDMMGLDIPKEMTGHSLVIR